MVLRARLVVLRLPQVLFMQMALSYQPTSECFIPSCTLLHLLMHTFTHTHRHTLTHNPTQMHTLLLMYP